MITIYTDGSKRKEGGGFGVAALKDNIIINAHQEQAAETTNNREELKAIIYALKNIVLKNPNEEYILYSDSNYCVQTFNNWMHSWAKKDWKNSKNQVVENLDLILELYDCYSQIALYNNYNIKKISCQVKWLKGHDGNFGNELVDAFATKDISKIRKIMFQYNLTYKGE